MNFVSCKFLHKSEFDHKLNPIFYNIYELIENFYYELTSRNNSLQLGVCTITNDGIAMLYKDRLINRADGLVVGCIVSMVLKFTHPTKEFETPGRAVNPHAYNFMLERSRRAFRSPRFLWWPKHKNTNPVV